MRNLLTLFDVSTAEIERIFSLAEEIKSDLAKGIRKPLLERKIMGLLFEKQSLRTRVSFETGMVHMGGSSLFLGEDVGWNDGRETPKDFGEVISQYLDVIVCRAKSHGSVLDLAEHCTCPIINGLTDLAHPCQALADLLTVKERFGSLKGRKVAFIGDGNNVSRSLALACAKMGMSFSIASPEGYEIDQPYLVRVDQDCPGAEFELTNDPVKAVAGACAVYTDVWASMGQESEQKKRERDFSAFQVNEQLMSKATDDAIFLHCLPAKRGQEVTDQVMDNRQSAVVQQAGNRMHAQKGVVAWLLNEQK